MQRHSHRLPSNSPGTTRELVSLHYGRAENGRKAYLQASLHADEPPGMLVLYHLRLLLDEAERQQRIAGCIVLVPAANPIGLSQRLLHTSLGRFESSSAENFNRNYPDLVALLGPDLIDSLGSGNDDLLSNRDRIRAHLKQILEARVATSELDGLRLALVRLAFDADIVLDLHCDNEGVMHLYTETPYWRQAEPLARYLGARVCLLAEGSGSAAGGSFDEALSGLWWRIPRQRATEGKSIPALPLAAFSATVELRGQADVTHEDARRDAEQLFQYLMHEQLIDGQATALPPLLGEPTPLAGSMPISAPHGGVVVFRCPVGSEVEIGTPIADIVEPMSGTLTTLTSPVRGCLYARSAERMVQANQSVARVAGREALRQGVLLGP